jgi:hypothetical protein
LDDEQLSDFRIEERRTFTDFYFPQKFIDGEWRTIVHATLAISEVKDTYNNNIACNSHTEAENVISDYKRLGALDVLPETITEREEEDDMSYMEPDEGNRIYRWIMAGALLVMVYIAVMVTPAWSNSYQAQFGFGQVYPSSKHEALVVSGPITPNTLNMIQFYHNTMGVKKITFHSPGGSAMVGFNIGYYMKKEGITAEVRKGNLCISACAFAFIMAEDKIMEGRLAFHKPYNTNNAISKLALEAQSLEVGGIFMNYIMEAGYGQWFAYYNLTRTGPDVFYVIRDWEEFEKRFYRDPKTTLVADYFEEGHEGVAEWLSDKIMSSEKLTKVFLTERSMMEKNRSVGPR